MTDKKALPALPALPASVMLPSGSIVGLVGLPEDAASAGEARAGPPYDAALSLLEKGAVLVRAEGRPFEHRCLPLCDFHALRAILTRLGWLPEASVPIECRNCGARIAHRPCAALELGPFVDRELHHPELDRLLEPGVLHPIAALRVSKRSVKEVSFGPLTLGEALPLHAALGKRRLSIDAAIVRAMGVIALGDERSPDAIARALMRAPEASLLGVCEAFLHAHYPPRLFSIAKCLSCGARNDVDAPYDREFVAGIDPRAPLPGTRGAHPYREVRTRAAGGRETPAPPSFEQFDERTRARFRQLAPEGDSVTLIVDGDVPACDEGGEPLLGSYVPACEGDASTPSRAAEVTVFYRTFAAIWEEDGPYDWEAELEETLEHELEHHEGDRRGHDEMDVEERRAIDTEAMALIGTRGTARLVVRAFAQDVAGFLRRTWPLWVIVIAATLATLAIDH